MSSALFTLILNTPTESSTAMLKLLLNLANRFLIRNSCNFEHSGLTNNFSREVWLVQIVRKSFFSKEIECCLVTQKAFISTADSHFSTQY